MQAEIGQLFIFLFPQMVDKGLRGQWPTRLVGSQAVLGKAIIEIVKDCPKAMRCRFRIDGLALAVFAMDGQLFAYLFQI